MRIRPSLRLARATAVCALAAGLVAASNAWSQSLIEALSTTYNSNPDLLAGRALLRQTDELLAQAVAQPLGENARHNVRRAPRRKSDNHAHRFGRKIGGLHWCGSDAPCKHREHSKQH